MAVPMQTGTAEGPRGEIGYSSVFPIKWSMWTSDIAEDVPELRWPASVQTYHRMRTDSQVDALLKSVGLPISRMRWVIDPNGAKDEVVEMVATDLGVPIRGVEDPPRSRRMFNHGEHLRMALLALVYGFMYFEQVGKDIPAGATDLRWRLNKLAPRMPQSIAGVDVDEIGELQGIKQWPRAGEPFGGLPIPVTTLAPYVWNREGADWLGRSALRPLYKHWIIKDRMLRVDAMKNERFGLGIPQASAPQGASKEVIEQHAAMARAARADPQAGAGLPHGSTLTVEGVRGTLPDTLATIQYHDEAMARDFLAMFLQLGSTAHGSRALGESFVDFFSMGVDAIAGWYADTTNHYVIEDMVDWNYGLDEGAPLLTHDEDPESRMNAADLVQLIDSGVIVVDDELRTWVTDRWGVSDPGPDTPTPPGPSNSTANVPAPEGGTPSPSPAPAPTPIAAKHRRRGRHAHTSSQTANDPRTGHRAPTTVEAAAKTDFTAVQAEWADQTNTLVAAWGDVRSAQIDELVQAVQDAVDSGSIDDLASITVDTLGTDVIGDHMVSMMEQAVTTAKAEATAQGITMPTISTADAAVRLRTQADAVSQLMGRGIATSAATQGLQRYGVTALSAADVAQGVRDHLEGLSDSYLYDMLGGALTQAQNAGRLLVMGQASGRAYSSELLDENTCELCADVDGTEYDNLDDAQQDYSVGGYNECLGGPRCRGTIVMVYDEGSSNEEA